MCETVGGEAVEDGGEFGIVGRGLGEELGEEPVLEEEDGAEVCAVVEAVADDIEGGWGEDGVWFVRGGGCGAVGGGGVGDLGKEFPHGGDNVIIYNT